jgi:hypothetical protein
MNITKRPLTAVFLVMILGVIAQMAAFAQRQPPPWSLARLGNHLHRIECQDGQQSTAGNPYRDRTLLQYAGSDLRYAKARDTVA